MDDLLGVGGESIVIKFKIQSGRIAIKIIPLDGAEDSTKVFIQEDVKKIGKSTLTSKVRTSTENTINSIRSKIGKSKKLTGDLEIFKIERKSENVLKNEAEFECSSIQHPNIIDYQNVTLDIVDDYAALLAGKIKPKIKLGNTL